MDSSSVKTDGIYLNSLIIFVPCLI